MMAVKYVYILPMLFSLIGSLLCLVRKTYFEEVVSVITSLSTVAAAFTISFLPTYSTHYLYIDGLSKVMLLMVSMVYASTVIFSTTYMKYIENPLFEKHFYYFLMNIFAFSMLFTVSVNDLGLVWIGIEATTVTSALLVATENTESTIEATWRYIIIVSVGLIVSLLSNIFIYSVSGTLNIQQMLNSGVQMNKMLTLGALMAIIGYGTKGGIFPMHTWLPDVHGKAPAPVSAAFSGILLAVALYAVARILQMVNVPMVKEFAFWLGLLTVATAATLMIVQKHYKRLFAYSTMENMGMILMGLSLGKHAFVGAVILALSHAFAKSSVFYLSGNILARYKSKKIEDVKGVSQRMPLTGYTLFFSALAVTGTPPFGTFIGELFITYGILKAFPLFYAILVISFLLVAFVSMNYKVGSMVFSTPEGVDVKERKKVGTIVPIVNTSLAFGVTFFIPQIHQLLSQGMIK
jgi:hydrogenase-4 component F